MSALPKRCTCCGVEYYPGDWVALAFCGYQDDGDGGRLELRHCVCGSTIAIEVTPSGLTDILRADLAEVLRNDARRLEPDPFDPSRKPSAEDIAEASRLHDIADELMGVDTIPKGRAAMDYFHKILDDARALVEQLVRERDEAQVECVRLARANGDLCDAIAEADKRIRQLEAIVIRVATWETVSPMTARAALLGMDDSDGPAVAEAWERSRWVTADTEAA